MRLRPGKKSFAVGGHRSYTTLPKLGLDQRDAIHSDKVETETSLSSEFSAREQELEVQLRETKAELEAAMEGLRAARAEAAKT